jgi:dynein heavy chain
MELVFFEEAIKYISKISRILMLPRSNAMLIGVAGSGKQSLTYLATYMLFKQQCYQLKLTKNFSKRDFKDSLIEKMMDAACDQLKTTFLVTDIQIKDESFLEEINHILNGSSEITVIDTIEQQERINISLSQFLKE